MSHWSETPSIKKNYHKIVSESAAGTGWSVKRIDSNDGPYKLIHDDGSEITVVNSKDRTGTIRLTYEASDSATEAFKDNVSDTSMGNIFEFVVHILERHEKLN